uniref:hypothetical protein n=1 Tax=Bacillus pacificus TaxID=2026187 RepID=UPI003980318D
MNRIDVLEKVKGLLLLPNLEMATSKQVAAFFETGFTNINNLISRNKEELLSDGMVMVQRNNVEEFLKPPVESLEITPYFAAIKDNQGNEHRFSNRGSYVLPRRAILRVGMLLRDSEVAKEVRTQLLNIEEKTTAEI